MGTFALLLLGHWNDYPAEHVRLLIHCAFSSTKGNVPGALQTEKRISGERKSSWDWN